MAKQTKNIITRDDIEAELLLVSKADTKAALLCGGAFALFFIPVTILIVCGVYSEIGNTAFKWIVCAVVGTVFTAPVWGSLLAARISLVERKKLMNGEIEVTLCTLQYKGERPVQRHIEEYFSFGGFGDVSVSHTVFYMATVGDEYYVVHYVGSSKIERIYPFKSYEYKEN